MRKTQIINKVIDYTMIACGIGFLLGMLLQVYWIAFISVGILFIMAR